MYTLTRRRFAQSLAAGAIAPGLLSRATFAADPAPHKISVSTWSFHNYFPNTRYGKPTFEPAVWTLQDVVRKVKEKLGLRDFEISSAHLASFETSYLDELNGFLKEQDCRFIHLCDNFGSKAGVNLSGPDKDRREADIKTFEKLIDVGQRLKIPTMRVNTGGPAPAAAKDWDINITIDAFRRLAAYGKERGVEIIIENHFGLSADPKNVEKIIQAVGENISACPDFGLLPKGEERWPMLETMIKHCRRVCSAKFHGFDAAGKHGDFDLPRCYRMLKAAKFAGWVSLEYEGPAEPMAQMETMLALAKEWLKGE